MAFESVRGYVELASGLTDLTRARALEAAQGLLSIPAAGIATGSKVAGQAGALADELLAAAAANRSNLRALVRSEVDVAVTRLGLVSSRQLEEAQAETARLRAELATLRSTAAAASERGDATKSPVRKSVAPTRPAKKAGAAVKTPATKATPGKRAVEKPSTAIKRASKPSTAVKTARKSSTAVRTAKKSGTASTPGRSAVTTRAKPSAT